MKPQGNFPIKATPRFYLLSLISGEMISVANLKVARSCWTQQTLMHLCLNLLGSVLLIRKCRCGGKMLKYQDNLKKDEGYQKGVPN